MPEPDLKTRLEQYAEIAGKDQMAVVDTDDLRHAAKILEWSADLYAAFCKVATNTQQREALAGYAAASNKAHS